MAELTSVVGGKLIIEKSQDVVIATMGKEEVAGRIAEIQTALDHLMIDVAAKQAELAMWTGRKVAVENEIVNIIK